MNHPSLDWKDLVTEDLKESKTESKIIQQHFRFSGLKDKEDYEKCYFWERARTEIFLNMKPSLEGLDFPFKVEGFPNEPYLSYNFTERSKFDLRFIKGGLSTSESDKFYNLLEPHLGSTGEVEIAKTDKTIFVSHTSTLKVPVELHIHPFWSPNELVELFRKQLDNISEKVKLNQKELERNGYRLMAIKAKKPIKTYQKKLKLLGHFRLRYCVKLDQSNATKHYGGAKKDSYADEPTMIREIKKCYPRFKGFLKSI